MAETAEFTTPKRKVKVIEFSIDGEDFHFLPPKTAGVMFDIIEAQGDQEIAAVKAQFDWLGDGLTLWDRQEYDKSPEKDDDDKPIELPEDWQGPQAQRLITRLKDPEDDLDWMDLDRYSKWVQKQVTGRPTG